MNVDQREKLAGLAVNISSAASDLGEARTVWRNLSSILPLGYIKGRDQIIDEFHDKLIFLQQQKTAAWDAFSAYLKEVFGE
ncbi:MAG TPA: hypothetical protein VIY48_11680 [Candidatus Paceibacterota bacterium]